MGPTPRIIAQPGPGAEEVPPRKGVSPYSLVMRPDQLEERLRERLDALPAAARAELLHVLMLPDFERLPEPFDHVASELGELVQEQHAVVRQCS
jgi:hypothetical protein